MDIWAWVNETQRELVEHGHERLAQLIEDLPSAVLADDNDEVEAMVPEALGLARSLNLPWVEIFVRHWHRQARGGGFAELPDAIELLEFSHREEHRACPQSVCTVQDIAIAYAGADGPGFAQERLDVSAETLERIDPTWPCFTCIATEYASALQDGGRAAEGLDYLRERRAELVAARNLDFESKEMVGTEASLLLDLGRHEEALALIEEEDRRGPRDDDSFLHWRTLYRAQALLALGRAEEAREALLPYDLVLREPGYARRWVTVMAGLVDAGVHDNGWRLGAAIEGLLVVLVERGRAWDAVRVAARHGSLAAARGAAVTARHALAVLDEQAQRLRDPARAAEHRAPLETALREEQSEPPLPPSAGELLEALGAEEDADPEAHVERLDAARRRWPDDLSVVMALAAALDALERPGASAAALREFAEAHPEERAAQLRYGFALLDARDYDELEALAARLEAERPADADWLRANRAFRTGDHRAAAELSARVVEREPEARNARRLQAIALEELREFARALELRTEIIELTPEGDEPDDDAHWMRMMDAAALGDWRTMRESAKVLEFELEGGPDEPPDERWEYIRLRFGPREVVVGGRTGPVTARVLAVAHPSETQHADDRVVYDPDLIEYPTDDTFALAQVVEVYEPGGIRSFVLDGVHPGEEAWETLADLLVDAGIRVHVQSGDAYELDVDGETMTGLYVFLGVPEDLDDATVHAQLTELTASLPHPLVWPGLAEAAGDAETAARHREIAQRLEL
jgi:tetratricopeptide (TPR) repeat protein